MAEADMTIDAFVARRVGNVLADVVAGRDRLGASPRAERIAHGEHIGIRANARIAKQVPGAADALALFQDHVGLAGAKLLQVMGSVNAGEARADDQHVEVFYRHSVKIPQPGRRFSPQRAGRCYW